MKGITDVEFILAVVLFLTVITFVTFSIVSKIPILRSESASEDLRDKGFAISELLMFDNGEPADWTIATVKRLGLSANATQVLDSTKISRLNTMCAGAGGYDTLKTLLGLDKTDVFISIIDSSGAEILRCAPAVLSTARPQFQITRFGVLGNKDIVMMTVDVF